MSCEHLICARCGGPVSEGRCPACRSAKADVHHQTSYRPHILIALAMLIVLLALLAAHGSL